MCETIEGLVPGWSKKEAEEIREQMLTDLAKFVSKDDELYQKVEKNSLMVIEMRELEVKLEGFERNGIKSWAGNYGYSLYLGKYNKMAKELRMDLKKDIRKKK